MSRSTYKLIYPKNPKADLSGITILLMTLFMSLSLNLVGQNQVQEDFQVLINIHSSIEGDGLKNFDEEASVFTPFSLNSTKAKDYLSLDLNAHELSQVIKTNPKSLILEIPIEENQSFKIKLDRTNILNDDFKAYSNFGHDLKISVERYLTFEGDIKGIDNSLVTATITEDYIKVLIATDSGNYFIAKGASKDYQFLKSELDSQHFSMASCYEEEHEHINDHNHIGINKSSSVLDPIQLYIETDYEKYLDHSQDSQSVVDYVVDLVSESAALFAMSNVDIQISEIVVWQTTDPYDSYNTAIEVLDKFSEQNFSGINGNLGHLISGRNLGGGYAWIDELCSSPYQFYEDWDGDGNDEVHYGGPFSISSNHSTSVVSVPTYSWNVQIFTHELGHSIGSPHTHACVWGPNNDSALDNCFATEGGCPSGPPPYGGGTIMSYCHITAAGINFNNGFGTEPGALIYDRYVQASCIANNSTPGETCVNAIDLNTSGTYTTDGPSTGFGATHSDAEHSRWFKFVANGNYSLNVGTCNDTVDTRLWIYEGNCDSLVLIAQSDDECNGSGGNGIASFIDSLSFQSGITYYLEWDDLNSGSPFSFDFEYNMECIAHDSLEAILPSGIYSLDGSASFDGSIELESNVSMTIMNEMTFEAGFEIPLNSTFTVEQGDCVHN